MDAVIVSSNQPVAEASAGDLYYPYEDLNQPVGVIWIESVDTTGIVPISNSPLNLVMRLEGASLTNRYYPAPPTKLADSLSISLQEPPSTAPKWMDLVSRKAVKPWYIFFDTEVDPSMRIVLEIKQKKGGTISQLLGEKVIASACISLFDMWSELKRSPNGVSVSRELACPKVNPEFEALNVPNRSNEQSRVCVRLRYERIRDPEPPLGQLAKVQRNVITRKVFLAPVFFKPNNSRDYAMNFHTARLAAQQWLNDVFDKIQVINIESVPIVSDPCASDSVVVWFKKVAE